MGRDTSKPVFRGLRTTKAQNSLRISIFVIHLSKSVIDLLRAKISIF